MKALLVKVEVNGVKFEKVCHSVLEAIEVLMAAMKVHEHKEVIDFEIIEKYLEKVMEVKTGKAIRFSSYWFSVKAIEVE